MPAILLSMCVWKKYISVKFHWSLPKSTYWKVSIGSGNGLVPKRQQAVTSANDDHVLWWAAIELLSLNPVLAFCHFFKMAIWSNLVMCHGISSWRWFILTWLTNQYGHKWNQYLTSKVSLFFSSVCITINGLWYMLCNWLWYHQQNVESKT